LLSIARQSQNLRPRNVSEAERISLTEAGTVGDVLYNFLDKDGQPVPHRVNDRCIAVSVDRLSRLSNKVLISGGLKKPDHQGSLAFFAFHPAISFRMRIVR
jgi:deoxyribonucleoside regulator